jgi:hypothetical protein
MRKTPRRIEHGSDAVVDAQAIGPANNHRNRATELGPSGYRVRRRIVIHLQQVEASAAASAGAITAVRKDAVLELWARTGTLLGAYADDWSADSPQARLLAADRIAPRLPPTGWLDRALTGEGLFVETGTLLAEWPT